MNTVCGFLDFCEEVKRNGEREGDWDLEAEIYEFMRDSANPDLFPTKKQLIDAGGWIWSKLFCGKVDGLSWDLDGEDEPKKKNGCDFNFFWFGSVYKLKPN
ncbi:hypothetical protein NL676_035621 [Syzygium grande]|nr:hypothetical protein NL676_035621 [Syzygium grande]